MALEVAVTGAFLTGRPLRVDVGEYDPLQRSLVAELRRSGDETWSANIESWRSGGTYHSGGGFANMLPLVLARRDGPAMAARWQRAFEARPDSERAVLDELIVDWRLEPRAVRVDVYDLGMAVIAATFHVVAPISVMLPEAALTLKKAVWLKPDTESGAESAITGALREVASETVVQYARAVDEATPSAIQDAWLAPFVRALGDGSNVTQDRPEDWGRLLWLHPVYLLEIRDERSLDTVAVELAPAFHGTVGIPSGVFVAGIGWSAIVVKPGASGAEIPLRLIELHWAYIALYMEIDRGLLALLEQGRWEGRDSLSELEADADRVFGDYMRVMQARGRLDSALASLGGDEFAMWELISGVTKFQPLVDGVDLKVRVLQDQSERRVQQAAARRDRRTAGILSGLTALTVVTVAVALIGNFLGTRSDKLGHISLRVATVAVALLLAVAIYREAFRERPARGRPQSRGRGA
jgi:hypothetical protein